MQIQPTSNDFKNKQSFKATAFNNTGLKFSKKITKAVTETGNYGDMFIIDKTVAGQPELAIIPKGELRSTHAMEGMGNIPFEDSLLNLIEEAGKFLKSKN